MRCGTLARHPIGGHSERAHWLTDATRSASRNSEERGNVFSGGHRTASQKGVITENWQEFRRNSWSQSGFCLAGIADGPAARPAETCSPFDPVPVLPGEGPGRRRRPGGPHVPRPARAAPGAGIRADRLPAPRLADTERTGMITGMSDRGAGSPAGPQRHPGNRSAGEAVTSPDSGRGRRSGRGHTTHRPADSFRPALRRPRRSTGRSCAPAAPPAPATQPRSPAPRRPPGQSGTGKAARAAYGAPATAAREAGVAAVS